ncbi:MAG: Xaa-Pro peptidase family protein [Clostridia bacterium]|nr:Xaa-Pro peptidase family protein [Clostridia bacterium]
MNDRLAALQRVLPNDGMDALIVTDRLNLFYLTGVRVFPGERLVALIVTETAATLVANRLFALKDTPVPLVEYDDIEDPIPAVIDALGKAKTVGVDPTWRCGFLLRLMQQSDAKYIDGGMPVREMRMVKDEAECAALREASRYNDLAIDLTIKGLREGMTELEACDLYAKNAKLVGSDGCSFEPLVCFGANCAEPHHISDDTPLKKGDAVILDVGTAWKDYAGDMTRTVFFGTPDDKDAEKVYELVKAANIAGEAAVKPGVPLSAFDDAARKVIADAGYGEYFIHRTGHNIGLDVHEYPDVSATSEVIARPGMCFSVEPGIYLHGRFGVRVEDLVIVTENGCEVLNHYDKEYTVL